MYVDDYLDIINDLRFVFLDEMHVGPRIGDMVTILHSSPELSKRECTSYVLKLCFMCLGHVLPELPKVSLCSLDQSVTGIDLADVIEPLQNHLLNNSLKQNIFTSIESIPSCIERLTDFGYKALQPTYDT